VGAPRVGTVVVLRFPFSDLSRSKLRPAVVLADAGRGDRILCQVTSKAYADDRAVAIGEDDFAQGSLRLTSYARPGKLFTAHSSLIEREAGGLTNASFTRLLDAVVAILRRGR